MGSSEKTVVILQSNYIPWKGYCDLIGYADEFILYDDAQYTRRDWRNRNKIKGPDGLLWLSVPVEVKGKYTQKIKDTRISNPNWSARHWKTLQHTYAKARYFHEYRDFFADLYARANQEFLSEVNHHFLSALCQLLGIQTKLSWSMDYELVAGKTEKLVSICKQAGATHYLTGPAARNYMDEDLFTQQGITVQWMDYAGYPEYEQLYPPFDHQVSVIDLIFSVGPNAHHYLKSTAPQCVARAQ